MMIVFGGYYLMLEELLQKTYPHLRLNSADGTFARQIMAMTLKWVLDDDTDIVNRIKKELEKLE